MSKQESKPVDSKVYWFMMDPNNKVYGGPSMDMNNLMTQRPLNYSRNKYYLMAMTKTQARKHGYKE